MPSFACDHDGHVVLEDLRDFKRLATKIDADTSQCCEIADDEEVLRITNTKTGQICLGARRRTAVAYRCEKGK